MSDTEILRLLPEQVTELIVSGKMRAVTTATPSNRKPERIIGSSTNLEQAKRIFGQDFFGPETVEKAFGIRVVDSELPSIPFNQEELLKAKDLDQMLVLRVGKFNNGTPVTMDNLNTKLAPQLQAAGKGKILYNTDWYSGEDFYTTEVPKTRWALVSKDVIPGSTDKNYLQQTQVLSDLLISGRVFGGQQLPKEYQEALTEFDAQKAELARQMADSDYYNQHWQEIAKKLSDLSINRLLRQTPVEVLYDSLLRFQNTNDERLLSNKYTWTCGRSSNGHLVRVGVFGSHGLYLRYWSPAYSDGRRGVCLSR